MLIMWIIVQCIYFQGQMYLTRTPDQLTTILYHQTQPDGDKTLAGFLRHNTGYNLAGNQLVAAGCSCRRVILL